MISALFVRSDSIYKTMGVDSWDERRNAMLYEGSNAIIAHPPCRLFSRLKKFSTAPESEKELAYFAVDTVRCLGGVLEHPAQSGLWKDKNMPLPGVIDEYGGYTLLIDQIWFGHKAQKKTFLYIVGCSYQQLPPIPITFDCATYVIKRSKTATYKKSVTKKIRDATPIDLAIWLIKVAEICNNKN